MIISLIVAVAQNGVIGKDNDLPWRLPNDLKFFKRTTMGKPIIMGRKTFESIGRPLPGRRNVVITRNTEYTAAGIELHHNLGDALKACVGEEEVCIIGGGSIYQKALDLDMVERIYLTRVMAEVEGDTTFELPEAPNWVEVSRELHPADEKHAFPYAFILLEKQNKSL